MQNWGYFKQMTNCPLHAHKVTRITPQESKWTIFHQQAVHFYQFIDYTIKTKGLFRVKKHMDTYNFRHKASISSGAIDLSLILITFNPIYIRKNRNNYWFPTTHVIIQHVRARGFRFKHSIIIVIIKALSQLCWVNYELYSKPSM